MTFSDSYFSIYFTSANKTTILTLRGTKTIFIAKIVDKKLLTYIAWALVYCWLRSLSLVKEIKVPTVLI